MVRRYFRLQFDDVQDAYCWEVATKLVLRRIKFNEINCLKIVYL